MKTCSIWCCLCTLLLDGQLLQAKSLLQTASRSVLPFTLLAALDSTATDRQSAAVDTEGRRRELCYSVTRAAGSMGGNKPGRGRGDSEALADVCSPEPGVREHSSGC